MSGISEIIKSLIYRIKKLDISKLPTQGFFYPKDFEISVKKTDIEDIIEYEYNYDSENLYSIIESVKDVVRKNTIFNKNYKFADIKSVDIVYIFLEIVKHTMNKSIRIPYFNDDIGKQDMIEFGNDNFNYFDFTKYSSLYDKKTSEFLINGFRFSLPSIGVENCLTNFIMDKSNKPDSSKYNSYSYDFLFYVGNKNNLSYNEIDNLIEVFNNDMDKSEKEKVKGIITMFTDIIGYSLKINGKVIDIKSKLNLQLIWK